MKKNGALLLGCVAMLALAIVLPCVSHAQSTGAPPLSVQRVSIGFGADWVVYRPEGVVMPAEKRGEFVVSLPVSYNLGRYASLAAQARYGLSSEQKQYSVGIRLHLLARGKRP